MKKLFLFSLTLLPLFSIAQSKSFYRVIETDSVGKTALFVSINSWFASNYNSANDVIQMADRDAGMIIGRGNFSYLNSKLFYQCYEGYVKYTIKVQIKDNRYRVELSDFIHESAMVNAAPACILGLITEAEEYTDKGMNKKYQNEVWKDVKLKAWDYSERIFNSLEAHTKNVSTVAAGDDW